ncbi:MAG: hemolysin III family protein [Clostridia bacterium]|nr:hemolysin III family protein [Clostridia bacterium]
MINIRRRLLGLPDYTLGEELMNSITHGVGALLGVVALVLCIVKSAIAKDAFGVVASSVYGATIIVLYSMSCLYHALAVNRAKKVFQTFDHCSIFLLIAGTYTPITLVAMRGWIGWTVFGIVWAAAIVGIVFNGIDVKKYSIMSMICYIAMGWVIVLFFGEFMQKVPSAGVWMIFWGGVVYTIGAVIYGFGKKARYIHSIWHFFVLAGSIVHFFAIYLYVL